MRLNNGPLMLDEVHSISLFDSAKPTTSQGETKTDGKSGIPLWSLSVSVRVPTVNRRESLQVEIASSTPSQVAYDTTVRLVGLTITPWSNDGRSGVVLRADALVDLVGNVLFGALS